MDKSYLSKFKGKKITFKRDDSSPDIKVKFVESFEDYKIKVSNDRSFITSDIVKYKIDESFYDVKLKKVQSFEDFQVYFEN